MIHASSRRTPEVLALALALAAAACGGGSAPPPDLVLVAPVNGR